MLHLVLKKPIVATNFVVLITRFLNFSSHSSSAVPTSTLANSILVYCHVGTHNMHSVKTSLFALYIQTPLSDTICIKWRPTLSVAYNTSVFELYLRYIGPNNKASHMQYTITVLPIFPYAHVVCSCDSYHSFFK